MKWNLFIYTYIHIYIYNKVIFQNKKLITVQNKSQRDRVRYFQMAMDKDSWRWGVGGGEGRGQSCVCVCVCARARAHSTQREGGGTQPGRPGVREERSSSVGGRLDKQGILLLLSKLYRFLLARQLCECE